MAGWLFLAVSLLGAAHVLNAWWPRRGPWTLAVSFFASWLTIELVWHHLVVGVLLTVGFVAAGALDTLAGQVALGIMVLTELGLLVLALRTLRTRVEVAGVLAELEPEGEAPRFPRSHVVLPILMGRRRGVRRVRDIEYGRAAGRRLRLDITYPPAGGSSAGRPALVQIHGGGWVIGDKREQGIPLLTHMAANGWVGVNVNYRLSPAATFPDHLVDCKRAIAWVREHAAEHGIDPDEIYVTGGSAGGHLAALVALTAGDGRYQPGFEDADCSVAGAVPFYGVYDFVDEHGDYGPLFRSRLLEPLVIKAFFDEEPERFEEASPIHHIHPGAPAFFVIHGDRDTLASVHDARRFVQRLREVSSEPVLYAEMRGAQHAFEIFPSVRAARIIEAVERFLTTIHSRRRAGTTAEQAELEHRLTG